MFAILSFIKFLRMKFTLTASFVLFDFSVLTYFFVLSFNVKFQFEWAKFKKIISAKKKSCEISIVLHCLAFSYFILTGKNLAKTQLFFSCKELDDRGFNL